MDFHEKRHTDSRQVFLDAQVLAGLSRGHGLREGASTLFSQLNVAREEVYRLVRRGGGRPVRAAIGFRCGAAEVGVTSRTLTVSLSNSDEPV